MTKVMCVGENAFTLCDMGIYINWTEGKRITNKITSSSSNMLDTAVCLVKCKMEIQ